MKLVVLVSHFYLRYASWFDDSPLEGICLEKDQVSDWLGRCEASYEGSGGLQEVQVCFFARSSPLGIGTNQDSSRHPNIIRILVGLVSLSL